MHDAPVYQHLVLSGSPETGRYFRGMARDEVDLASLTAEGWELAAMNTVVADGVLVTVLAFKRAGRIGVVDEGDPNVDESLKDEEKKANLREGYRLGFIPFSRRL